MSLTKRGTSTVVSTAGGMTPAVYYRVNLYCRGESDKERNKHCCQHCWWNDPCCTASAVSCLCDLWAKNHWSKLNMFLELPQLGTCHSCCVNLTQFQGQIIVFCHITTKYCVKTPFWLRVANCFRSIVLPATDAFHEYVVAWLLFKNVATLIARPAL